MYKSSKFDIKQTGANSNDFSNDNTPLLDKDTLQLTEAPKWRKVVVIFCGLALQFVSVGLGFGLSVMYPVLIDRFQTKRSDAALIQGLYMGMSTGGGILWAPLIKRYGPGKTVVVGALVCWAGLFSSSQMTELWMVILCTGIIAGTGMGVCYLSAFIMVSWVFHKDPGVPLVCLTVGSSFGQFAIPYMYEVFIEGYGWSGAFVLVSGIALQCVPIGLMMYGSRQYFKIGKVEAAHGKRFDTSLFTDVLIWILLMNCLLVALTGNVEAWFIVDIMTSRGFSRQKGSILVSIIGGANCVGRLAGTFIRFKFSRTPTIAHWVYICPVLALAHILVISVQDYNAILGSCILQGVFFGITNSHTPALMYEAAGHDRYPNAMSLVNLMYGFGNLFSNVLGGIIRDQLGVYDLAFYISSGTAIYMTFSSLAATLVIYRRRKLEEARLRWDGNSETLIPD